MPIELRGGIYNLWAKSSNKFMPLLTRIESDLSKDTQRDGAYVLYGIEKALENSATN